MGGVLKLPPDSVAAQTGEVGGSLLVIPHVLSRVTWHRDLIFLREYIRIPLRIRGMLTALATAARIERGAFSCTHHGS